MKAVQYNSYGDTSVLSLNENATDPQPKAGQVLIKVSAAGINPVESKLRLGYMQQMIPLTFPVTTGGDFSGVIELVGEGVTQFKSGDEVYGVANQLKGGSGAAAEFVIADPKFVAIKPHSIDFVNAASLPLVGTSVLQALEEHIKLSEGQKILIHGGAGGIGSLAIVLAKLHGAYVATTANAKDTDFLKGLGADEVIDYKTQDFTTILKDYDAVYDTAGGETTNKSFAVLKKGGVLVSMANQPDEALAKEHEVIAMTQMSNTTTEQLTRLAQLVDEGKIKPQLDKTFSFDQAKEAYDYLDNGHPKGKVVIKVQD